jgi:hypothetical protein
LTAPGQFQAEALDQLAQLAAAGQYTAKAFRRAAKGGWAGFLRVEASQLGGQAPGRLRITEPIY